MNLCESLRQIIAEYGVSSIGDGRLPGLIAEKGTDVAPGAAGAIRAFAALGLGKELSDLSSSWDGSGSALWAAKAEKALIERGIRSENASFVIRSILSALGLSDSAPDRPECGNSPQCSSAVAAEYAGMSVMPKAPFLLTLPDLPDFSAEALRSAADSLSAMERGRRNPLFTSSPRRTVRPTGSENAVECLELGEMYLYGDGIRQSSRKAAEWFRKAARQGDADAEYYLGIMHKAASGVRRDAGKAAEHLRKAVLQGHAPAQVSLGAMYLEGTGVPMDKALALEWFRKAAEQGNPQAQNFIGMAYEKGEAVGKDYAEALSWYRKAAEGGSASAEFNIGTAFLRGQGVRKDLAEAERYRRAAGQGNESARMRLGGMYFRGEGAGQNYAEALKWYRQAAEQGNHDAQKIIGDMYCSGLGTPENLNEALKWYGKSGCCSCRPDIELLLGDMYFSGNGVKRDYTRARKWYEAAGRDGIASALYLAGGMYEAGQGMRPDLKTAVSYYLLSAGKGDAAAAYRLGRLYEEGYNWKDQTDGTFESLCHADNWPLVIDKDYDRALGWYLKSALSGSADAGKSLRSLALRIITGILSVTAGR